MHFARTNILYCKQTNGYELPLENPKGNSYLFICLQYNLKKKCRYLLESVLFLLKRSNFIEENTVFQSRMSEKKISKKFIRHILERLGKMVDIIYLKTYPTKLYVE